MRTAGGLIITNFEDIHDYHRIVKEVNGYADVFYDDAYKKALEYGIERTSYRESYIEKGVRIQGSLFEERRLR